MTILLLDSFWLRTGTSSLLRYEYCSTLSDGHHVNGKECSRGRTARTNRAEEGLDGVERKTASATRRVKSS